jgi:hypothetical protein
MSIDLITFITPMELLSGLSIKRVARIVVLIIIFLAVASKLGHNLAMLQLAKLFVTSKNIEPNRDKWLNIADAFKFAVSINPHYPSSHAWLAQVLLRIGQVESAEASAYDAARLWGRDKCYVRTGDELRIRSKPGNFAPEIILPFDHPFSVWSFSTYSVTASTNFLTFVESTTNSDCVAVAHISLSLAPNHFVALQHALTLKPDRIYRLSALVRATKINRVWMGVYSQWSGLEISDVSDWTQVQYEFRAPRSGKETVQFIFEDGQGTFELKSVRIEEMLQPAQSR